MNRKSMFPSTLAGALVALAIFIPTHAGAHMVQAPCDSITSGGYVLKHAGEWANFAAHGGCKNGDFWGEVNFVDHEFKFHLKSTQITGYLFDPARPNSRDICGRARVNDSANEVSFRVHLEDNGEPGTSDKFGIVIDNWNAPERFYIVSSRALGGGLGGGNVQLHKGNRSNSASPGMLALQEWQMCGDLDSPR
ncbi:MAG TPA: post-COAP-1 domain-containing protein [Usitatibacter sp.]|nr:post-COAP-1 domain-containing protein [Usitatibacter sp.]